MLAWLFGLGVLVVGLGVLGASVWFLNMVPQPQFQVEVQKCSCSCELSK